MWQEGNRVAREKGGDPNPMFGPLPKEITDFLDNVPENNVNAQRGTSFNQV